jgi:hypothetical protein
MAVYDPRGGGNVHIDKVLTNISVGYPNNGFIADRIAPPVRVAKQTDKYYVHGREGWVLEPGSDLRAPGGQASEIPGLTVSTDQFFCQEHALEIPVTDEEREMVDSPLAPDREGTELITDKLLLGRELIVRDLSTTAANYAAGYSTTLSGTTQWSDYTNSNPITAFKVARRTVHAGLFIEPNNHVFPYQVMSILEDHPQIIDRIKYSQAAVITEDIIGRVMGFGTAIVPGAGYNTARMGQAAALGYIWGKDVFSFYNPPSPGLKTPAFMYEFVWPIGGQVQTIDRRREENRISDILRVRRRYDHKFIVINGSNLSTAGYIFKAAVA